MADVAFLSVKVPRLTENRAAIVPAQLYSLTEGFRSFMPLDFDVIELGF